MLLAPPRGGKNAKVFDTGFSVIVMCIVESNSMTPGPEVTVTTNFSKTIV